MSTQCRLGESQTESIFSSFSPVGFVCPHEGQFRGKEVEGLSSFFQEQTVGVSAADKVNLVRRQIRLIDV